MKSSILVGPLLGFEAGNYYSVCILLPPGGNPELILPDSGQSLPFAKVDNVGGNEFWRAEFTPAIPAAGTIVNYTIKSADEPLADQHKRKGWQFYLPGANEQPLFAYASCNGFSSAKLASDTSQQYLLWEKMAAQHTHTPFSLLLMGGDQVYADEIWESNRCPALKKWGDLDEEEQHDKKRKVSATMSKEIAAFYDWLYQDRWKDESMSLMFASIPSIMMWDDHDIFDGWGSYPEERQSCPVYQEIFKHASRVFDLFQLRGSPRSRLNAQAAHRTLTLQFRDYHLLVLDNRAERTLTQIMSEQNWTDLKQWLTGLAGQAVKNLWVMTAVPAVYRSFTTIEAFLEATPWQEEAEDDVMDHWSARRHAAERMRLVMVLLNFLEQHQAERCKALLLSGDVHVGALGRFRHEQKQLGITQIISSGIVHPPPSFFQWLGIQAISSDKSQSLGAGEVIAEMLTPLGGPDYLRTRNFVTLQTGTDAKVWINWICENEKWQPSFAVS